MTTDQNKETVRRFYEEVWNKGNVDFAFEVFAEDYIRHDLRPTEALPGPEGQRKIAADFRAAFPDLQWNVDLILAEGDLEPPRRSWLKRAARSINLRRQQWLRVYSSPYSPDFVVVVLVRGAEESCEGDGGGGGAARCGRELGKSVANADLRGFRPGVGGRGVSSTRSGEWEDTAHPQRPRAKLSGRSPRR